MIAIVPLLYNNIKIHLTEYLLYVRTQFNFKFKTTRTTRESSQNNAAVNNKFLDSLEKKKIYCPT